MKPTIDSLIESSVFLWLDNVLVEQNAGFYNYQGDLKKSATPSFSGYNSYLSPHRQWVYDSSISGAQVPTGALVGSTNTPRGTGLHLNFNNGEALMSTSPSSVKATYSFKDINIYFHNETEETVLFDKKFSLNPRTSPVPDSYQNTDAVYPCIFIIYPI